MQHLGSCLCGAVSFKVEGAFDRFFLCHCTRCRKGTGSAHGANLFSSTAKLEWLAGEDKLKTFNFPQTRHVRCFCSVCGSAMPYVASEFVMVPAGCLDTHLESTPDAHVFAASRAAWDQDLGGIRSFDAFPP
jgi:hypothetical protein